MKIIVYLTLAIFALAIIINIILFFVDKGDIDTRSQDKEFRNFKAKQDEEMARQIMERNRNNKFWS
jgi:hypothetical protein